jgi:hypothetical protein
VLPAARDVVDRAERIVLTERDTVRVPELPGNPLEPTPTLIAAARRRLDRTSFRCRIGVNSRSAGITIAKASIALRPILTNISGAIRDRTTNPAAQNLRRGSSLGTGAHTGFVFDQPRCHRVGQRLLSNSRSRNRLRK